MELRVEATKAGYTHMLISTCREQIGFSTRSLQFWFEEVPPDGPLNVFQREQYRAASERVRLMGETAVGRPARIY